MIIVSIDVGYVNLGLTRATVDECFNVSFIDVIKINLRHTRHTRVPACECKIPHTNETCDRIAHFLQEYEPILGSAETILIERQPIMGLKDVEGLIMSANRSRTILVSPNSMHRFFGISKFTYDERKVQTEKIAEKYVGHMEEYQNLERKHDIADAVCLCLYHVDGLKREADTKRRRSGALRGTPLDQFRL
jgi:hypothetical protein|tara:strand:+ start:1930 stop:2502 length:573 start_codon:yes stop_codon:yes gene_type:complete